MCVYDHQPHDSPIIHTHTHTPKKTKTPKPQNQERREGHFRYLHACVRHQLEAIALYRGLPLEGQRAEEVGAWVWIDCQYVFCVPLPLPFVFLRVRVSNTQTQPNQINPNHHHQAFTGAVQARRAIIRRHAPLYFSTYFFDYIGAVVNYAGSIRF